jgi:hypothetical protein
MESVASTVIGGIALFVLSLTVFEFGRAPPSAVLFYSACSMERIALAAAPAILLNRLRFKHLPAGKEATHLGSAAICSILSAVCFALNALFFELSMFR